MASNSGEEKYALTPLLYRLYSRIERVIVPGLRYSQGPYEDALCGLVNSRTVWLDIGCGHHVLPEWRFDAERELVSRASYVAGIDMDRTSLAKHRTIKNTWMGSAEMLPFPDSSFNLITANMVVEHLADPCRVFDEIRRILTPGGVFLFHTPNIHGYVTAVNKRMPNGIKKIAAKVLEGRDSGDVYPTYYRCNSERAIIAAANFCGFKVEEIRHIPTNAAFAKFLPMAALELLWIRATMRVSLARYRTNILGFLCKAI